MNYFIYNLFKNKLTLNLLLNNIFDHIFLLPYPFQVFLTSIPTQLHAFSLFKIIITKIVLKLKADIKQKNILRQNKSSKKKSTQKHGSL